MPPDNVETLRAVYARWEQGDFTASLPLFGEDSTLAVDLGIPDGGNYEGTEGVRDYMARFLDAWESLSIAAESYEPAGDTVLVKVRQSGVGRGSGVPVETRYFQRWTFRDGLVTRLEVSLSKPS